MPEFAVHWAGYAGVALYLSAYSLLQSGVLRGSGYVYTLMNLTAAAMVLVSLSRDFNLSSALIQSAWVVVSLVGLARRAILQHRTRFTAEEAALGRTAFPALSPVQLRRLLDIGRWESMAPGAALTEEGAPVRALHFIVSGQAAVSRAGHEIARIEGGFVGELNVLAEGAASATVRIDARARVFVVPGAALRGLIQRDDDLRARLMGDLRQDTARKLARINDGLLQQAAAR